jgi:dihydroorotate dehydrogenase (NAD+) catalytic subunit
MPGAKLGRDAAFPPTVDLAPRRPGALVLRTRVIAAAGSLGYGVEAEEAIDLEAVGAMVTRGTSLAARRGGAVPRMALSPAGVVHAIGIPNPGIDAVLERYAPRWAEWPVPVILSCYARSADEMAALAERADRVRGVAALELDLATPEAGQSGRPISYDAGAAGKAAAAARAATDLPLLAKVSPATTDVRAVTRALAAAGADAVVIGGGLPADWLDPAGTVSELGGATAVLSGPATRPVVLRAVREAVRSADLPVVGGGGVTTVEDVLAFLAAGAVAVQVGLAALADPAVLVTLGEDLATRR